MTNSRQREDDDDPPPAAEAAAAAACEALPGAPELDDDVDVLFQNFTTPSALPVITYPCRRDEQACVTVCLCMYDT